MAAPMRDGALDGGHRGKVADPRTAAANFEYDDNEWDIGIGDLIIDLDADIEKTKEKAAEAGTAAQMAQPSAKPKLAVEHSATVHDKGLKMKIKRTKPGTKTSEAKHEIVKPGEQPQQQNQQQQPQQQQQNGEDKKLCVKRASSGGHRKDKARDKPEVNGVVGSVVPRSVFPASHGPGPPAVLPSALPSAAPTVPAVPTSPGPPVSASPKLEPPRLTAATPGPGASGSDERSCSPPPAKKPRNSVSESSKDAVDVCVGTSVGTITEPDCLGPCEPGTSVTLEGIVWHETGAGVLVVNVTWRGKTYVGTLLDCTRHDWAPPRFCDSPTSDLDARTPKGRGKRGRTADLSNFTETRSSVHSKLRNGNGKGRPGRSSTPSAAGPGSPTPRPEASKPKSKDKEKDAREATATPAVAATVTTAAAAASSSTTSTTTTAATATTANASTVAPRKVKAPSTSSPPPSPVLLECPEPNCCKKYKHINGLKYHQSHAHGSADDEDTKDGTSLSETEESNAEAPSPADTAADKTEPPGKETPTPAPQDPLALPQPSPEPPSSPPLPDSTKSLVKPGVLRFGLSTEDFAFANKAVIAPVAPQPLTQASVPQQLPIKLPQFKVKPAAALMPEEKPKDRPKPPPPTALKKKKKSPEGSPHPTGEPAFGSDSGGREDLQSPAYSDISDDAAPVLESEVGDKTKGAGEKKGETGSATSPISPYVGLFNAPYYNQPPYLLPSVPADCKAPKESADKVEPKQCEKEVKKEPNRGEYPQKILQHPSHYYSYGYVAGYPGGFIESGYPVMVDKENKEGKEDKSPGPVEPPKHAAPPIQVPTPGKVKSEPGKHSNENHQILKESIEMKSQMGQFLYSRQPSAPMQEDLRRFLCQRGKEPEPKQPLAQPPQQPPLQKAPPPNPSPKQKEKEPEKERKEKEVKQEGQKPTMETQGPPPPPTGQFAYIHPSYMQGPHYTTLPFDPSVYRGMNPMLVPGPYGGSPYLGMPRYHAPEDLSRPQGPTKALDLLQHHANQYYSSHKIHELQERAMKSPTPGKATPTRESPSAPSRPPSGPPPAPPTSSASAIPTDGKGGKLGSADDSRSPPTQRHVHTHHHTHVGLTYPLLPGQYPPPYGAAVLATQQAGAVINPYQPK